ncbi:MAG TPA: hypothetical protein VFB43_09570 [Terracidiphilus sp.]|nr:hypothetical protein [Terracidiphilus sp.]
MATSRRRWSERHVYYTLAGTAGDIESIRKLARCWLDKGAACANPAGVEDLLEAILPVSKKNEAGQSTVRLCS